MSPKKFSLAVSGDGVWIDDFVIAIKRQYPSVTIYDRNEEANRPPSDAPIPRHPKVADVDAVFIRKGQVETATIRSFCEHRFFNYEPGEAGSNATKKALLLRQMVEAVGACVL